MLTLMPLVAKPKISQCSMLTRLPETTLTPLVPATVMLLVMVRVPKPPGSSASISPPAAVFEMAPAQVLQGAVRLHGLTSSPTPDTHVREACAWAIETVANMKIAIAITLIVNRNLLIVSLL